MAKKRAAEAAIETFYYSASGPGANECAYLGQRYEEERGFKPFESECWIMAHDPAPDGKANMKAYRGTTGWFTRLWRSDSGAIFVSSATDAKILYHPDLVGDPDRDFVETKLSVPLNGVWGLNDDFVLTWGATFEGTRHLFRRDGKKWKEMKAPDFEVRAIHGLEEDLLYAVGVGGGVARWDGRAWKRFPVPTDEVLNSVFVAGPDEIYATGAAGMLLEGSAHGWGKIGEAPVDGMPLLGVAKWKKELWVAGGQFGLLKREGTQNKLTVVKPNLWAVDLDARAKLVICCKGIIGETANGKDFLGFGKGLLQETRDGEPVGKF